MKLLSFAYFLLFIALCINTSAAPTDPGQTALTGDQGDGTFRNPVLAADYSDSDVCRVGDDFYMVASTFESSPGVTVMHSKDLVNWKTLGAVFADITKLGPYNWDQMRGYKAGAYAPTIHYHDNKFWVFVNMWNGNGFFVATATNPAGPWTVTNIKDRNGKPMATHNWTDPCPFWDDDGSLYLVTSHPCKTRWFSYMFKMSPDGTQLLDADIDTILKTDGPYDYPNGGTIVSPFHSSEGNRLYKRNGYYYFFHIEFLNTGQGIGSYVMRSKNLYGTLPDGSSGKPGKPGKYEPLKFDSSLPGQGGMVDTAKGDWFWMGQIKQADSDGRCPNLVPVTWIDNWPAIGVNVKDHMGQMVAQMKKPISDYPIAFPLGSDEFDSSDLGLQWQWNHQPRNDHWSLTERPGFMRLHAWKPLKVGDFFTAGNTLNQRFVLSGKTTIVIKLELDGMENGQHTGLAHFNGGKTYATLSIVKSDNSRKLQYTENGKIVDGPELPSGFKTIFLRSIVKFDELNRYAYSFDGTTFTDIGGSYKLSSGNFRGDMVGIFTFNDQPDSGYVDIDFFHYTIQNR
jgi:beta-xylosidase